MQTTNNTILVTGGGSGIGLAIATAFAEQGNRVIITGRNEARLQQAAAGLPNTTPIAADVTSEADVDTLVARIKKDFGGVNILVNNAGMAYAYPLSGNADAYTKGKEEFELNFFSVVRLTEKLLPLLVQHDAAAIVNISSIVAYGPITRLSTYSASKAALHSYTQALRLTLEDTAPQVKVFEVFPPFVDTDMTRAVTVPKLPPSVIADDLLAAISREQYEIHNGMTKDFYGAFLASPDQAVRNINATPLPA